MQNKRCLCAYSRHN